MHNLLANKRPLCTFNDVTEPRSTGTYVTAVAAGGAVGVAGASVVHAAAMIIAGKTEPRFFNLSLAVLCAIGSIFWKLRAANYWQHMILWKVWQHWKALSDVSKYWKTFVEWVGL